jgi:hypothetical protein
MDLIGLPEIFVKHDFHFGCEIAAENDRKLTMNSPGRVSIVPKFDC